MEFEDFMDQLVLLRRKRRPYEAIDLCKEVMEKGEDSLTKYTAGKCLGFIEGEAQA